MSKTLETMAKRKRIEHKLFDTQTEKGLKQAERFKARLENAGYSVRTTPFGFTRVRIVGVLND